MRFTVLLVSALLLLPSCGRADAVLPTPPPPSGPSTPEVAVPVRTYEQVVADLTARRRELGRDWMNATQPGEKPAVLQAARAALHRTLVEDLIPPWFGTEWAFYGTSQTPGQGQIACGYFVSTVLRDAGLRVERVRLAQQASSNIARTFAGGATKRFSRAPHLRVVEYVEEQGAGVYIIGLDYHVGLLTWDGEGPVQMCHSSVLWPGSVLCEDAGSSEAMISGVHVVGAVLTDAVVEAWIEGKAIPTHPR